MARRRAHGEGSIRQRGEDRWEGRFTDPTTGKRHSVYAKTQKLCREAMKAALRRIDDGLPPTDSRQLLRTFIETYLDTVVKPKRAHKTWVSYSERARLDILPHLGDIRLVALTPQRVQQWMADLLAEKDEAGAQRLSARTVRYDHSILRAALNIALKWGLVQRNVAALAEPPTAQRTYLQPWSVEEAQRLIDHVAGTRWEGLYRAALGLGLRMSEMINLLWSDVDLARGKLTIRTSKTRKGERTLNLPRFMVEAFQAHRERQRLDALLLPEGWNKAGYVFPSEEGTRLWHGNLRASYKRHLAAAGVRPIRFHDMRHSCASFLLNEGVPVKQVSEILGHAQVSTTSEIYWHVYNESQRGALDVGERFAGRKTATGSD
jgi:integrase